MCKLSNRKSNNTNTRMYNPSSVVIMANAPIARYVLCMLGGKHHPAVDVYWTMKKKNIIIFGSCLGNFDST